MNGLEAIELMKKGITVMDCNGKLYRIDDNCVKFRTISGNHWACEVEFNFLAKYEEYLPVMTGWERVGSDSKYSFISDLCNVREAIDKREGYELLRYDVANYFSTKEKAEEINFKQALFRKLQRFSDENGGSEIDWTHEGKRQYFISCDYDKGKFVIDSHLTFRDFGAVYFESYKVAEQALEMFEEDLIKYFTHDWSKGE